MLEYGINFNSEEGRRKAEAEIRAWMKDLPKQIGNVKLKVDLDGVDFKTPTDGIKEFERSVGEARVNLVEMVRQAQGGLGDKVEQDAEQTRKSLDKLTDAVKEYSESSKKAGSSEKDVASKSFTAKIKALSKAWNDLTLAQRTGDKGQELITQFANLTDSAGRFAGTLSQVAKAQNTVAQSATLKEELKALAERWEQLTVAQRKGDMGDAVIRDYQEMSNAAGRYIGSIQDVIREQERLSKLRTTGGRLVNLQNIWEALSIEERRGDQGRRILDQYQKITQESGVHLGSIQDVLREEKRVREEAEKKKQIQEQTTPAIKSQTAELRKQSQAMNQLKSYAMNFLSVYAGIRLTKNLVSITGEFEAQRISLQAILRDAEQGEAIFNRIKGLAVESPFMFKDLISFTKQLSAFSVPYEELYDTTKMLADVSAGLGVEMSRIILAYGQVRSASVLRGQELRQFTEAGIPLVDELAKKFTELRGELVSTSEVFDLISDRQVPFEMIKDIFAEMTEVGGRFYQMQEKLADTLKGKVNNLTDAFQIMLHEIGDRQNGLLKGAVDSTRWLIQNYEIIGNLLISIALAYGTFNAVLAIQNALLAVSTRYGIYDIATKKLQTGASLKAALAQSTLNKAIMANPYVLAGAAIVALAASVYMYTQRADAATRASEILNRQAEERTKATEAEKVKIWELVSAIKDETATRMQKEQALKDLKLVMPGVLDDMDLEAAKLLNSTTLMKEYNLIAEERNRILQKQSVGEGRALLDDKEGDLRWSMSDRQKAMELMGRDSRRVNVVAIPVKDLIDDFREWVKQGEKSLSDLEDAANNIEPIKYDTFEGLIKALSEAEARLKDLQEQAKEGLIPVEDVRIQQEAVNKLKESLSLMGWEEPKEGKAVKDNTDAIFKATERLADLRAKMAQEEKRYALEVWQTEIDMMEDSAEKELNQIQLNKAEALLAIEEREAAMLKSNEEIAKARWMSLGGEEEDFKVEDHADEIALTQSQLDTIASMRTAADIQEFQSKEDMLNALLDKYKDYAQRVTDIEERLQADIKNLNSQRTIDNSSVIDRAIAEAQRQAKEELASMEFDQMKNSDAWRVLFSDLENHTIETLKNSLAIVEQTDTSNLNPADAKAIQQGIDKLKQRIDQSNPFFALKDGWDSFIRATQENQPDAAMEAMNRMMKGAQDLADQFQELSVMIGTAFGEDSDSAFFANSASDAINATVSTGTGMARVLSGDLSGITEVIKGVTGYINVFRNLRNRKHEKEIQKQAEAVKLLEKQYDGLTRAMEDSLGADLHRNAIDQSENLKKQAAATQKMIDAEKKKGKDTDKEKVAELEAEKQRLIQESVDVVKNALETLAGTDLTSAAEDFAKAWLDAYVSFGNTTEAMQKRFKDMMKDMVVNALLSSVMQRALEPILGEGGMIDRAWDDGRLSPAEIANIFKAGAVAIDSAGQEAASIMEGLEAMGVNLRDSNTNLTGISKGVSTITEDTALVLGGYLNSIRFKLFEYIDFMMLPENRPMMAGLIQSQTTMITHLQGIEANTKAIELSNSEMLGNINRVMVSTPDGWKLNVNA